LLSRLDLGLWSETEVVDLDRGRSHLIGGICFDSFPDRAVHLQRRLRSAGIWKNSRSLARAAYYNLIAAAVTALAAVGTGLLAWQLQLEVEKLRGNLRLHLSLGATSAVLIWLLTWWRTRIERPDDNNLSVGYWALALIAVLVVALTGHLGGILSGVEVPN
jgi:uncharacterized membrane protein